MTCKNFESRPHRSRQNLDASQAAKSCSRLVRELTTGMAGCSTISGTMSWMQTTGLPTTPGWEERQKDTMILADISVDRSGKAGHFSFFPTKELVYACRPRSLRRSRLFLQDNPRQLRLLLS